MKNQMNFLKSLLSYKRVIVQISLPFILIYVIEFQAVSFS